jgi:hypothetical protein
MTADTGIFQLLYGLLAKRELEASNRCFVCSEVSAWIFFRFGKCGGPINNNRSMSDPTEGWTGIDDLLNRL